MASSRQECVGKIKTEKFEYLIKVENFGKIGTTHLASLPVKSNFTGSSFDGKTFSLNLSCKVDKYNDCLEVEAELTGCNFQNVTTSFGFLVDDDAKKVMLPGDPVVVQHARYSSGVVRLAILKDVMTGIPSDFGIGPILRGMNLAKCNFMPGNALSIVCEVEMAKIAVDYTNISSQLNVVEEEYSFVDLLESGDMSDITVVCREKTFSCHSAILGGKSPVFKAMLNNNCLEKETQQIVIKDMEVKTLEALLTYCYGGKPNIKIGDEAINIVKAADQYDIQPLKRLCEKLLITKHLSVESCLSYLVVAELHSANILKSGVLSFLASNAKIVVNHPLWDKFVPEYPQLATDIFREISGKSC